MEQSHQSANDDQKNMLTFKTIHFFHCSLAYEIDSSFNQDTFHKYKIFMAVPRDNIEVWPAIEKSHCTDVYLTNHT